MVAFAGVWALLRFLFPRGVTALRRQVRRRALYFRHAPHGAQVRCQLRWGPPTTAACRAPAAATTTKEAAKISKVTSDRLVFLAFAEKQAG